MSCDTWFYRVGSLVYNSRARLAIQQMAWKLGLGKANGFDGASEAPGLVPTPASVQRLYKQPWYEGQTINLSIGQGYLEITPLQLAVAYSALANGGTVVRPHVGDAVLAPDGTLLRKLHFRPQRARRPAEPVGDPRRPLRRPRTAPPAPRPRSSATSRSRSPARRAPPRCRPAATSPGTPPGPRATTRATSSSCHIDHGGFGAEAAAPAARDIYSALFHLPPAKG